MNEHSKLLELLIRTSWNEQSDLHEKWIKVSYQKFGSKEDPHLHSQVQQLGRVDLFIRLFEQHGSFIYDNSSEIQYSFDFIISLSNMWLAGLFDVIRIKNNPEYGKFRKKLSLIRAPLTKHLLSGKREYSFAEATLFIDGKLGWEIVNPDTNLLEKFVRQNLADEFLSI